MITWLSRPSTRFLYSSARRWFSKPLTSLDFVKDSRYYNPDAKMANPEDLNVDYEPPEELYKPPHTEDTRMIFPKTDTLTLLREHGIVYENLIPAQSAYFWVKRQGMVYHVFDASRIPLGRMAGRIARYITGKYKPTYDPKVLANNDRVIVVNGSNIKLTGKQRYQKVFRHHTGYAGGLHEILFKDLEQKDPQELIRRVVRGMIAPNKTRKKILDRIIVFPGQYHTYGSLKIPQFMNQPLPDPTPLLGLPKDMKDLQENYTIVAEESDIHGKPYDLEEVKDMKRDYDKQYFMPRTYYNMKYRPDPSAKKINKRERSEYEKKMRRLREFK